ncbi:MAG: 16S rRNA (cytidine(1402)-2'-O)-methyltransferase [Sphingomonadales bacterium]
MTMEAPEGQVNLAPGLYLVATPIGNLRDVTLRALDVLRAAAVIACEDTRITRRLLDRYGIETPLVRYDDHSSEADRRRLIERVKAGEAVALASDAGTPLVSDPGFKLVRAAVAEGIDVVPIPGASSVLAALCLAGLPTDRFSFGGFLPEKQAARRSALNEALRLPGTVVVFEAARRLPASLADLAGIAPERPVVVARELTKRFEEAVRGTAAELAERYRREGPPRGEVVLVIGPPDEADPDAADLDAALREALRDLSVKEAASAVAFMLKLSRRQVYARAVELSQKT